MPRPDRNEPRRSRRVSCSPASSWRTSSSTTSPSRIAERAVDGWDEVLVALDEDDTSSRRQSGAAGLRRVRDEVVGRCGRADRREVARCPRAPRTGRSGPRPRSAGGADRRRLRRAGGALGARLFTRRLRTYQAHERGHSALDASVTRDITCDLPLEHLPSSRPIARGRVVRETTQAEWLTGLGIDDLVVEGRATWRARTHRGPRGRRGTQCRDGGRGARRPDGSRGAPGHRARPWRGVASSPVRDRVAGDGDQFGTPTDGGYDTDRRWDREVSKAWWSSSSPLLGSSSRWWCCASTSRRSRPSA